MAYTWKYSGSNLVCPYCGKVQEDVDYDNDDDWECQECGGTFEVNCEYEPCYRVRKMD